MFVSSHNLYIKKDKHKGEREGGREKEETGGGKERGRGEKKMEGGEGVKRRHHKENKVIHS